MDFGHNCVTVGICVVRMRRWTRAGSSLGRRSLKMLVGSRRFVTSSARYRAVSESTAETGSDDDDDRYYDDEVDDVGDGVRVVGNGSYESLGTCDHLILNDPRPTRSRTGMQLFFS